MYNYSTRQPFASGCRVISPEKAKEMRASLERMLADEMAREIPSKHGEIPQKTKEVQDGR